MLTAVELPDLHHDDKPLVAAFAEAGWRAIPVVWSEPIPNGDLALVRSCWDYTKHLDKFLSVAEQVEAKMPLWNPSATLRWNASKRYLLELASSGINLPATVIVEHNDPRSLSEHIEGIDAEQVVIKPLVGASGMDTWLATDADQSRWASAISKRDLMVQEFLPEIESEGELSLVFLSGRFSHAVVKRAAAGEFRVQEEHGGSVFPAIPSRTALAAAEHILAVVRHPWMYARVDGVMVGGEFVLMELEVLEPELFFELNPPSAHCLVEALTA